MTRSWLVLGSLVASCSGTSGTSRVPVLAPGIDFTLCVLTHAAADAAKHDAPLEAAEEILSACGGDLVLIAHVLDGDTQAHETGATAAAFRSFAAAARTRAKDGG